MRAERHAWFAAIRRQIAGDREAADRYRDLAQRATDADSFFRHAVAAAEAARSAAAKERELADAMSGNRAPARTRIARTA